MVTTLLKTFKGNGEAQSTDVAESFKLEYDRIENRWNVMVKLDSSYDDRLVSLDESKSYIIKARDATKIIVDDCDGIALE